MACVWTYTKYKQLCMEMPQPDDVAAIQRLLGLAQYLSKFLPHLSDITKPLRELTQKDTKWTWGPAQQNALETLKKAGRLKYTCSPVLQSAGGGHPAVSGALRTGSRAFEAILWLSLNQFYDK